MNLKDMTARQRTVRRLMRGKAETAQLRFDAAEPGIKAELVNRAHVAAHVEDQDRIEASLAR